MYLARQKSNPSRSLQIFKELYNINFTHWLLIQLPVNLESFITSQNYAAFRMTT